MENGISSSNSDGTDHDPSANNMAPAVHMLCSTSSEASEWAPDLVIYHDKCADGIVAAWACWKRWGDAPDCRAANYGHQPPSDVADKHILIVDFSWPADELLAMIAAGAASIVILDHHKTAQGALKDFAVVEASPGSFWADHVSPAMQAMRQHGSPPILAIFDMERSGARMAWDFAHPGEPVPRLVELAERYDLWRFLPGEFDDAELLHLVIQTTSMSIWSMDCLQGALDQSDEPLIEGRAIYDWRAQLMQEIASRAHVRTVAGVEGVISVECPYSLVSAVGHHLLDKHPAAPFAAMSVTGEKSVTWSLRSHDDRADVSEVAKRMGGGGHRNAAGFRVEGGDDLDSAEARLDMVRTILAGIVSGGAAIALAKAGLDIINLTHAQREQMRGEA